MKRYIFIILLILALAGIADAGYLTYEHYAHVVPTCTINRFLPMFSDCGAVLRSKYSLIFGVPLALLGLIHYIILSSVLALAIISNKKFWWFWVLIEATAGAFASVYFMYLQIGIIGKFCISTFSQAIIFSSRSGICSCFYGWNGGAHGKVFFEETNHCYVFKNTK